MLYYLGLLSFAGEREGRPLLKIPNRTVRQLMYGYLRAAYDEVGVFRPSTYEISDRLNKMAYRGQWEGFFDYLAEEIAQQASIRDFLQGEKVLQGFLLAWLNLSPYFRVFSEVEQGGGFVDLYLAPFYFRYPDMRHAYLIELKYLSRSGDRPAKRAQLITDAQSQLRRYAADARIGAELGAATLHPILLLYSGWELVHREAVAS
ncbi:PD-(D/E)XK nuclease domain-containing protein [Halochromatium sp.]